MIREGDECRGTIKELNENLAWLYIYDLHNSFASEGYTANAVLYYGDMKSKWRNVKEGDYITVKIIREHEGDDGTIAYVECIEPSLERSDKSIEQAICVLCNGDIDMLEADIRSSVEEKGASKIQFYLLDMGDTRYSKAVSAIKENMDKYPKITYTINFLVLFSDEVDMLQYSYREKEAKDAIEKYRWIHYTMDYQLLFASKRREQEVMKLRSMSFRERHVVMSDEDMAESWREDAKPWSASDLADYYGRDIDDL